MRMKEKYLDLIGIAVSAYSDEHIARYTDEVRKNGVTEHGYPRLCANIGFLLAHGRCPGRKEMFAGMMELCCREMLISRDRTRNAGNDFSVKELVFCLEEIEKSGIYESCTTDHWREILSEIDPYRVYSCIAEKPPKRIGNWAAFSAVSEQARKSAGIGDVSGFIENQVLSQLFSFDENGMYRDPHEPMVYDFVTRLQLALCLDCGYDGAGKAELEEFFEKSAVPTLLMQSVCGEIPYGGRSNQFLHNETFYAALCEFYASRYFRAGRQELAGMFRSAARLAVESLERWLCVRPIHHIKNRFPPDSKIGCEGYGYFDKYMVTMGSWACMAYRLADDRIPEVPCPAEKGGYVWQSSEHFHKLFLCAGGYTVQADTAADPHYDSCGIGRIHKAGAPAPLCLSVPFPTEPSYTVGMDNPAPFAISCGVIRDGEQHFASRTGTVYTITEQHGDDSHAYTRMRCTLTCGETADLSCRVSADGVILTASAEGRAAVELPVFVTDGERETEITTSETSVAAAYRGWQVIYDTDGVLTDTGVLFGNRNGRYRRFTAEGDSCVTVTVRIVPDETGE